jgi:hypothetical protein
MTFEGWEVQAAAALLHIPLLAAAAALFLKKL